ncbi:YD repeat protein [Pseudomonas chlororaphis]|uniref:YD repeat protein n=1 Tax=Pseudomonas chlororaphis TaxID=587753 RepID=A0A3G7TRM0_9PSED|nr:RHS repeat-associated core domain-containing protein [Pseudomonas chlororaphis]AZE49062.1 YD repeat protein [Pseudomonas chlororaphis]
MNKVKNNASKNQRRALDNPVSVRANEPFLPTQQPGLRENVPTASIIGFNGQLFDSVSGTYLLGNGYRAYSPTMRAFYSPDSLSPFGAGGVSRYQYCNLNPVNYTDPSGHSAIGIAISIIAILSAVTGAVSVGLEIGRKAHSESDPEYSAYLQELAIGFGTASVVLGVVAGVGGVGRSVFKAYRTSNVLRNRSATGLAPGTRVGDMRVTSGGLGPDILTHGRPFLTQTTSPVSGRRLAEQLADVLPTGNLTMTSCYAGFGGRFASQAQVVANSLGRTVVATAGRTNAIGANVVWKAFSPQGAMRSAITQTINTGLSNISAGALHAARLVRTLPRGPAAIPL